MLGQRKIDWLEIRTQRFAVGQRTAEWLVLRKTEWIEQHR